MFHSFQLCQSNNKPGQCEDDDDSSNVLQFPFFFGRLSRNRIFGLPIRCGPSGHKTFQLFGRRGPF